MSKRGIDFLENWVQRYVTDADKNCTHYRAAELADRCIQEAAQLGITIEDMEPEFGTIQSEVYEASHAEMNAELDFWKAVATARR